MLYPILGELPLHRFKQVLFDDRFVLTRVPYERRRSVASNFCRLQPFIARFRNFSADLRSRRFVATKLMMVVCTLTTVADAG